MMFLKTLHHRVIAVLGCAGLVVAGLSAAQTPPASADTTPPPPPTNWALQANGGSVTASGRELNDRWGPEKLIDGIKNPDADKAEQSRWSSDYSDNAWATVTFQEPHRLHHVNLFFETACATSWKLLASEDGTSFKEIHSTTSQTCPSQGEMGLVKVDFNAEQAQVAYKAIKLQVVKRATQWGASLWEIEAFDGAEPAAPTPSEPTEVDQTQTLVPKPVKLTKLGGEPFTLTADTKIVAPQTLRNEAEVLAAALRSSTGFPVEITESDSGTGNIKLALGQVEGQSGEEAYSLQSSAEGVTITGVAAHGVFNGCQTLRQLFPGFIQSHTPVLKEWKAPAVSIVDAPRFFYRGMMLDIARSFIPRDDIMHLIDTMSHYKISVLHLHLSDDQGWRIEITNEGREPGDDIDYTRLTNIGGKTSMGVHEKQFAHELGLTGFLTQEDYKAIQAYAKARHMMIVPEIDVPGHTNSALHSIPQLNTPGSSHPATEAEPTAPANLTGAVGYSYLDPKAEVSMTFVRHVLKQIAEMSDSPYIHIGGDEPFKFVKVYSQDDYNAFLGSILKVVHDLGKTPIGWNEISAAEGLKAGDVMHYWVGNQAPTKAAIRDHGGKVLLSMGNKSYLDQKYNPQTPIALDWACRGRCDFPQYYNWDPRVFFGLSNDDAIVGTEAPLWSETVRGIRDVEFLTFNRVLAHAEIGWTPQRLRSVKDFTRRVNQIGVDLNAADTNFYDGPEGSWAYDVAGLQTSVNSGSDTVQLGYLSAPGTVVDADDPTLIKTDTDSAAHSGPDPYDDHLNDGISKSEVGDGMSVTVQWPDGETSKATITPTQARTPFNASYLYLLTGTHQLEAGTHEVTLTIGQRSAKAVVTVDPNAEATAPIVKPWKPTGDASLTLPQEVARPRDWVDFNAAGFEPGQRANVTLNGKRLGQFKPGKDGSVHNYLYIPPGTPAGVHKVVMERHGRQAVAYLPVWAEEGQSSNFANPISNLRLHDYDSEELNGEAAPNGRAAAAIDGNPKTFWHTEWKNAQPGFPHHISLNLSRTCRIDSIEYTPRQDNTNTRFKDYEVYVSADGQNWGSPEATGRFQNSAAAQAVHFAPVEGQYVKLLGKNSHNGDSFGGAGEIRVGGLCGNQKPAETLLETAGNQTPLVEGQQVDIYVEAQQPVTLKAVNLQEPGQVSLWVGDDHQVVGYQHFSAGEEGVVTFQAAPEHDGAKFTFITPAGRRHFVVHLGQAPTPEPTPDQPAPTPDQPAPTPDQPEAEYLVMATAEVPWNPVFKDINIETMFAGEIKWLRDSGITTGYSDGTYRIHNHINRDAMAAFLYRMAGSPVIAYRAPAFKDVSLSTKYHYAMQWMYEVGISEGYADGTYRPLKSVNRDAMAAFLHRFCDKMPDRCAKAVNPDTLPLRNDVSFTDVPIDYKFFNEINWLVSAKITTGWKDGTFRPTNPINRDAMAAFLYRMKHNYMAKK